MECTYFQNHQCRSCELLELSYEESILKKEDHLKNLFLDHTDKIKQSMTLTKDAEHSRSKAKLAVFTNSSNELSFGFYSKEGAPKELEHCPLHLEGMNELLGPIRDMLIICHIQPYDLKTKKGEIKYLLLSKSEEGFLLRFVLRSKESLDRLKKGIKELIESHPTIQVVTANIQPIHQAILEGEEEILLSENKVIWHHFDEFRLALGARSFFQVTPEIAKKLYGELSDEIKKDRPQSLLDLYCGVGAFSFYTSRYCRDVVGVEISSEAIRCAQLSCEKNQKEISFFALDVEEFLKAYQKKTDAILVNPPRRGLNSAIISSIKKIAPEFIYYSSCNAETLKRDFLELQDQYELNSLQLFDMFPYTAHYEVLTCLKKK